MLYKNSSKIKSIHFVGVKGVGMAPLAVIAKEAGFEVSGSDIAATFITDKMLHLSGIFPFTDFDASHILGADLVITTGAHGGFDNVEVIAAKESGIPILTQGEAVSAFMKGEIFHRKQKGISIAGTHGKTTTSAMIATILQTAGWGPSWVIGTSDIPSLGISGHFGRGEYFVAEADEYANEPHYDKTPKMLLQHPEIAVVTNIEHDHPDIYPSLEDVVKAFDQFLAALSTSGIAVVCGDDDLIKKILGNKNAKVITYGFSLENEYVIKEINNGNNTQNITFIRNNKEETFSLYVPGEHNVLNALSAYIVAEHLGIPRDAIKKGLESFSGTKRRLEYIGDLPSGAILLDDYAHHPTEIKKTLQAVRIKFPQKKIVCLFQPHTYSRTKLLLEQFITSLSLADTVILTDIYPSAREAVDPSISSVHIVEGLVRQGKQAHLAQTLAHVVQYVHQKHYSDDTVIITMGAGDIYTIAKEILEHESAPSLS